MPSARKPDEIGIGFPGEDDYQEGDWDAADSFLAPVVPAAKFEEIGDSVSGTIVSAEVSNQTDIDGAIRTFDGGEVRTQLVVTIDTGQGDEDDDGLRKVYVKSFMVKPFRNEMKRCHVKGVRPGGHLTVTYTAAGEIARKGYSAPKLFAVAYEPPAH